MVTDVIPSSAWPPANRFPRENLGLVIAEIELRHEHQHFDLPPWVGEEVTGQAQYYNGFLAQRPFSSWPHDVSAMLIERKA